MTNQKLKLNQWLINLDSGELVNVLASKEEATDQASEIRMEPQGVKLLCALAKNPGELVAKEQLLEEIWQDTVVTDDALTRCVSRVRKALQDNARQPAILETIPKRGYRLIADEIQWLAPREPDAIDIGISSVDSESLTESTKSASSDNEAPAFASADMGEIGPISPTSKNTITITFAVLVIGLASLLLYGEFFDEQIHKGETSQPEVANVSSKNVSDKKEEIADKATELIAQGDDYYAQIRRQDNEMAIELYQQAMAIRPESGAARAGLANALVQQVLRWSVPLDQQKAPFKGLFSAIAQGRTSTPEAVAKLARARNFAQQGVERAPNDPRTHKALGLVLAAQEQFEAALQSYYRAVELNPDAWDAYINIGDILENSGDMAAAVNYYKETFEAMQRVSIEQAVRIRPWHADMGAVVGERYMLLEDINEAEVWFRHVLSFAPFNRRATEGLAQVLVQTGDKAAARRLCQEYIERIGEALCAGFFISESP